MRVSRPLWLDEVSLRARAYRKRRILTNGDVSSRDWSQVGKLHSLYKRRFAISPAATGYIHDVTANMLNDASLNDDGTSSSDGSE